MDLHLRGEGAVVLGAAQGIGLAIATAFAREGAYVALIDRSAAIQERAQELQREYGVTTVGLVADVTQDADMPQAAAAALAALGDYAHVVYAVGRGSGKFGFPFWNLEPADWPDALNVNLLGAVRAAHAFAPRLVSARRGALLFLSSIAGQIGSQTDPPYSAAKAALINFAQCAAKDLAPYNVRVNTLCPGMVKTELNRAVWQSWNARQPVSEQMTYEDWAADKINKVTPLRRWQEPEDMAAMAVFLASPHAANITGQTLNVDGGQVMHW